MGRHVRRGAGRAPSWLGSAVGVGLLGATGFVGSGMALAEPLPTAPGAPGAPAAPAPPGGVAAPAPAPAGDGAPAAPCAKTVKACARLSTNEAWLTDGNGTVLRGPIRMSHGAKGEETPVGSFTVLRKDATHVSQEQAGVPMPWSVFFDNNGRAFHGGDPGRESAGCVHLATGDAQFFFDHLNVGDSVQILP